MSAVTLTTDGYTLAEAIEDKERVADLLCDMHEMIQADGLGKTLVRVADLMDELIEIAYKYSTLKDLKVVPGDKFGDTQWILTACAIHVQALAVKGFGISKKPGACTTSEAKLEVASAISDAALTFRTILTSTEFQYYLDVSRRAAHAEPASGGDPTPQPA